MLTELQKTCIVDEAHLQQLISSEIDDSFFATLAQLERFSSLDDVLETCTNPNPSI